LRVNVSFAFKVGGNLIKLSKDKYISEIFLASDHISKEDWHKLILLISKYVGYLKKWELVINIDMNEVRYYVISTKELASTIGGMSDFVFKKGNVNLDFKCKYCPPFFVPVESNLIDIYDKNEIKHYRKLKQIKLGFFLLRGEQYISSIKCIFENLHDKSLIVKRIPFNSPSSILSTNYAGSRFFYKKRPKYLNIQKAIHLLKSESSNSILKVDTFPYLQGDYYLNQNEYSFDKHSIIVGGSGTGKSKFMSLLINNIAINQDYRFKYKIIVIDPHASLENDIGGMDNTKVLNFINAESSVDLFGNNTDDVIATIERLLSLFKSLLLDQYNSKIERVLRYTAYLLLVKKDFSFLNIRKVILDTEYRLGLVKELSSRLPDPVIDFFLTDYNELKTRSYNESISPIVSFIDEIILLPVFNNKEKIDNMVNTIKDNFITVFSLDRTKLGEKATKTIAGLALGQIMELVKSFSIDEHILLMIDEVPVIELPLVTTILSEARKYNLSLILATQYFNQISPELRSSIFANISNYYVFRVSKGDATLLENNLTIKIANNDDVQSRVNLLSELNDRECIVRVDSNGLVVPAIKAKTLDYIPKPRRKIEIKPVSNIVKVEPKNKTSKLSFNIESEITLNDIMIEQSSSRKKISKEVKP
jgi:hypothetical protein